MTLRNRSALFRPSSSTGSRLARLSVLALSTALACGGSGGTTDGTPGAGGTAAGGGTPAGGAVGIGGGGPAASGGAAAGGTAAGGGAATGGGDPAGGAVGVGGAVATGGTSSGGGTGSDACSTASALDAEFPECFVLTLSNPLAAARTDAFILVPVADIAAAHPDFNPAAFVVLDGATELSSQSVDQDPDETADSIVFVADLAASQTKELTVRYATSGTKPREYPQRAQAIVSPKTGGSWNGETYTGGSYMDLDFLDITGHIDHDYDYLRFEGPGWESDRIGHRVYMDRRNGIDIFGKKLPGMILQDIDYVNEDYSTMSDWGMDILKVGEALGLGSPGTWENGAPVKLSNIDSLSVRILESGPVYALLRMSYGGWQTGSGKVDITADISIAAGSRVTKMVIGIDGTLPNICAGLIKHDGTTLLTPSAATGHTYLAHYGNQSLVPDNLGMGVLYKTADQLQVVEDTNNHLAVLKPTAGSVTYYLTGAWVQEGNGLTSQQAFKTFLDGTILELDSPVAVAIQ